MQINFFEYQFIFGEIPNSINTKLFFGHFLGLLSKSIVKEKLKNIQKMGKTSFLRNKCEPNVILSVIIIRRK